MKERIAGNHRTQNEQFVFPHTRDRTKAIYVYLRLTVIVLNKVVKIAKADGDVGALKGEG